MKDQSEHTLVVNIHLTRGLVVLLCAALLTVAWLGSLAWGQKEAAASGRHDTLASAPAGPLAATADMRHYYLYNAAFNATYALTACASGYHMASLWEMLDTSNLQYNTALGVFGTDSGSGPPTVWSGWVRTGYNSNNGTIAGQANCNAWTSTSGYGTYVSLPSNWTAAPQDIHVWTVGTTSCGNPADVWCVED
jgi:hypothetical protein